MIELEDCGKVVYVPDSFEDAAKIYHAKVSMVIKAPRGSMELYEPGDISSIYTLYVYDRQAEAIKAFMEEHND